MNSSEKILLALQELYDKYDCTIKNEQYRGPMKVRPEFTVKQIAERAHLSSTTVRKWCKILHAKKKITWGTKHRYYRDDPITYIFGRLDLPLKKLVWGS